MTTQASETTTREPGASGPGSVATPPLDGAEILRRAIALGPDIDAQVTAIEQARMLPAELFEQLRQAGVFRMAFPRSWGGPEMRLEEQVRVIEVLAEHDASTAWAVQILADSGFYAGQLPDEVAREIFPSIDLATAGAWVPPAKAVPVEGGFELTGRWPFGSGIRNADRVLCGAYVHGTDGIELDSEGQPREYLAFLPIEQVTLHDTWYTTGLAGSGSTDYSVDGVFVPARHMFNLRFEGKHDLPPLTRSADVLAFNGLGVVLGLTRHVLDELLAMARRTTNRDGKAMAEEYRVLTGYAEADARYQAARAFVYQVATTYSQKLWAGESLTPEDLARGTQAAVLAADLCRTTIMQVTEIAGAKAIFASGPFDRCVRDMLTISRHIMHQQKSYEHAGQLLIAGRARHVFA